MWHLAVAIDVPAGHCNATSFDKRQVTDTICSIVILVLVPEVQQGLNVNFMVLVYQLRKLLAV